MRYLLEDESGNVKPSKVKAAFGVECLLIVTDPKTSKRRWFFELDEPIDDFIKGVFREFLDKYRFFVCTKGCTKIVHWIAK